MRNNREVLMRILKVLFKKNRTIEEELVLTAFVVISCLFVVLPILIILSALLNK